MSVNVSRLSTMLEIAGRPSTSDGEALNAIRAARTLIDRDGKTFTDLINPTPQPISTDISSTMLSNCLGRISTLEKTARKQTATIKALAEERDTLRVQVEDLTAENDNLKKATALDRGWDEAKPARRKAEAAPKERKPRNPGCAHFKWADYEREATALFLSGARLERIMELAGCNRNQVLARFFNGAPPAFLEVTVRSEGPIDWPEAWLIGQTIFRKGWMSPTLKMLGIVRGACKPPMDINAQTTPELIAALRARYHEVVASRPSKKAKTK